MTDFNKLYEDNYRLVLRYLMKLCADGTLAEELTQETFFKAYVNLRQLKDEKKPQSGFALSQKTPTMRGITSRSVCFRWRKTP